MKIKEYSWLGHPDEIRMRDLKLSAVRQMDNEGLKGGFLHQIADFLKHQTSVRLSPRKYK